MTTKTTAKKRLSKKDLILEQTGFKTLKPSSKTKVVVNTPDYVKD